MIIETWVFVLIFIGFLLIGLGSIVGWVASDMLLEKQIAENKKLRHKVEKLQQRLAHMSVAENIRVANEYYEESKKNG